MTRDDIISMAKEAGYGWSLADIHAPALERFAALVAAAEREACAKVCLEEAPSLDGQLCADAIRDAIRARGEE